jgi:hypothetical protein
VTRRNKQCSGTDREVDLNGGSPKRQNDEGLICQAATSHLIDWIEAKYGTLASYGYVTNYHKLHVLKATHIIVL